MCYNSAESVDNTLPLPTTDHSRRRARKRAIRPRPTPISWETLAKVFGLIVAAVYTTGFFITFTFLAGYGIPEFGADVFRLKYLYVGVLCSFFPILIAIPLLLKWRDLFPQWFFDSPQRNLYARYLTRTRHKAFADLPAFLTAVNMVVVIYVVIGLFTAGQYRSRHLSVELLILFSVTCLLIAKKVSGAIADLLSAASTTLKSQRTNTYSRILLRMRYVVFGIAVTWDFYVCHGIGFLHVMKYGFLYALLMLAFAWRIVRLDTQLRFERFPVPAAIAGQSAMVLALYIVGCLSYTVFVYPLISVNYGGGSFSAAPSQIICVDGSRLPSELVAYDGCTVPVKIIHTTDSMVFVARTFSDPKNNTPAVDMSRTWQNWNDLPRLYGIATKTIVSQVDSEHATQERVIDQAPIGVYSSTGHLPNR